MRQGTARGGNEEVEGKEGNPDPEDRVSPTSTSNPTQPGGMRRAVRMEGRGVKRDPDRPHDPAPGVTGNSPGGGRREGWGGMQAARAWPSGSADGTGQKDPPLSTESWSHRVDAQRLLSHATRRRHETARGEVDVKWKRQGAGTEIQM